MKIAKNRTNAYLGTFDLANDRDVDIITKIRQLIKSVNKNSKIKCYVKLQGRLGENNPNAEKYWHTGKYHRAQCIRLPDAQFADAYLYERR